MTDTRDEPIEPTVYGLTVAVDNDGDTWVSATDVVRFLRAAAHAIINTQGYGVTPADMAEAFRIEADALDLWTREATIDL